MNQPSPYEPPSMASAQSPPSIAGAMAPASIRVFGVLHLVFAGMGILGAIWSIASLFMQAGFGILPESDPHFQAQVRFQEQSGWTTWVTAAMGLGVAAVMIPAGIKLLRNRSDALRWSNLYAWSSISAKIVSLGLTVAVIAPAMRELVTSSMEGLPGGAESMVVGSMVAGGVIGVLMTLIYPVLTLILLNRQPVKDWLARGS